MFNQMILETGMKMEAEGTKAVPEAFKDVSPSRFAYMTDPGAKPDKDIRVKMQSIEMKHQTRKM
jgi:hypothetical protein